MKAANGIVMAVVLSLISVNAMAAHKNKHVRAVARAIADQQIAAHEAAEPVDRYAYISSEGVVNLDRSSGIEQANVTTPFGDIGIYCFTGLNPVKNIQALIDILDADDLAVAYGVLEYSEECPVLVAHIAPTGGLVKAAFFVELK